MPLGRYLVELCKHDVKLAVLNCPERLCVLAPAPQSVLTSRGVSCSRLPLCVCGACAVRSKGGHRAYVEVLVQVPFDAHFQVFAFDLNVEHLSCAAGGRLDVHVHLRNVRHDAALLAGLNGWGVGG